MLGEAPIWTQAAAAKVSRDALVGRTGLIVKVKPKAADNVKLSTPYSAKKLYNDHEFLRMLIGSMRFCVNGH